MPLVIPINLLRASAFGAAIVCALLLLQYAHRRKPFILLWAAGWLAIAPGSLLISRSYDTALATNVANGVSQLFRIVTSLLFFWSGDLYRQSGFVQPSRLRPLVPLTAWFVLSPMLFGAASVQLPGYVISAVLLAAAGSLYAAVLGWYVVQTFRSAVKQALKACTTHNRDRWHRPRTL